VHNLVALIGVLVFPLVAFALSTDRRDVCRRTAVASVLLQLLIAGLFFRLPGHGRFFRWINDGVLGLMACGREGIEFVFGWLATPPEGEFSLAVEALPMIVFFAALVSLLYYLGVMQVLIRAMSAVFTRILRISGAEALVISSNVFVGIESALTVRPYLLQMTTSELLVVLTGGMATVASSTLALYIVALKDTFPEIAVHLISANLMSAPAAVCMAKLLLPETGAPVTLGRVVPPAYERPENAVDAVLAGANEGMRMVIGIVAALIAFLGVIALLNMLCGQVGRVPNALFGWSVEWKIQSGLAVLFYPFVVLMGVPLSEVLDVGRLLADRLILTEVPAYFSLAAMLGDGALSARSAVIASYALCGFAHVASVAIFVGGVSALVPERAGELSRLGFRALLAATLACLMTGAMAGLFYHESLSVLAAG
jgi:CNT family concentrative nucleoside transporter